MSLSQLWDEFRKGEAGEPQGTATARVWSIGYERFTNNDDFARVLATNGIERLLDVRDLPISRKRGFAKTALAEKLAEHGIEYVHAKGLGNPKEYRDLYKSGQTAAGRKLYSSFLLRERADDLRDAVLQIENARTALMCVEHDQGVCHRDVIFEAMRDHLGLSLQVSPVDSESCSG